MNNRETRTVEYQGNTARFHQWLKKANAEENYKVEYSYALIEMKGGTLKEVPASEIRFKSMTEQLDALKRNPTGQQ